MLPIRTETAPPPLGHYEQAIVARGLVFSSIQLPIVPNDDLHQLTQSSISEQAKQLFANIESILNAARCGAADVVRLTLYVTAIKEWDAVNRVATDFFRGHRPARGVVVVPTLHMGYLVAADFVAEVPD